MPGISVDGMDVEAVRKAAEEAVDRARKGGGPTLIECKTYRFFGHSRGDASVYRTKQEEVEWKSRCPVASYKKKLIAESILTEKAVNDMEADIADRLNKACDFADKSPYSGIETLYDDVYA
jgi:TPP-dependent pyruvate/acetoin dehydrogenase alpha subunit